MSLRHFAWENWKTMNFSEAVVACDIKVDLCRQQVDLCRQQVNFYKYQRSRSFTDFCLRSLRFSSFKVFSKTTRLFETKLHIEP